jgi:NAD(P)-dependent dehydrogenase (short-subunit alcohol dehydrogenase family)
LSLREEAAAADLTAVDGRELKKKLLGKLDNKIAFITGTATGQGRAAAQLFAREGALIVGCDLKVEEAAQTAEAVKRAGGTIFSTAPVDLGDPEAVNRWIADGVAAVGGIDILYNNAGAVRFGSIEDFSIEDWRFTVRNELDLVFFTSKAAWPHLKARGGGVIINIASTVTRRGAAAVGGGAHMATKAGVIAFTKQLAAEGARYRIRANSISPGLVDTPATAHMKSMADLLIKSIPLGRWGQPDDIAYCALYLASDDASWVTAADFTIDGGMTGAG